MINCKLVTNKHLFRYKSCYRLSASEEISSTLTTLVVLKKGWHSEGSNGRMDCHDREQISSEILRIMGNSRGLSKQGRFLSCLKQNQISRTWELYSGFHQGSNCNCTVFITSRCKNSRRAQVVQSDEELTY